MDNSFLHTKRLLLVDDEQELLKMVSDILKDAGFETALTAMTVKEAILTAKEETPDLIVLDVMLPHSCNDQKIQWSFCVPHCTEDCRTIIIQHKKWHSHKIYPHIKR